MTMMPPTERLATQQPSSSSSAAHPAATSATQIETEISTTGIAEARVPDGTLRLRGGPIEDRRVTWGEDVIDNEGMGRKKSKVCCIYHRPRAIDESSSSEEDSDEDSDYDSGDDRGCGNHAHGHGGRNHSTGGGDGGGRDVKGKGVKRSSSPNAYEKMPKLKPGKKPV